MDLMEDEGLKKSVIDQMMGELDDVTSDSLKKKPENAAKGVEISIIVTPHGDEPEEKMSEGGEVPEKCDVEGCEDPSHDHGDLPKATEGNSDYISELLKKLG